MDDTQRKFYAHTPVKGSDEWHDLVSHLKRTSEMASGNASKFGAGELGRLAGLWHDVGKFNPAFQRYLRECHDAALAETSAPRGGSVPHAVYGAVLAREYLGILTPVIHGHHMGLQKFADAQIATEREDVKRVYAGILPVARRCVEGMGFEGSVRDVLSGVPEGEGRRKLFMELHLRMVFSALVDADFLDTERHFDVRASGRRGAEIGVGDLRRVLRRKQEEMIEAAESTPVNVVRKEVYRDCLRTAGKGRGVFRITVPTGGGKTRSGLAFALEHAGKHGLDRVIVAVPYTSIIDQTASTYRGIFRELGGDAVLEHHSAVRREDAETESFEWTSARARLAAENWDAPLVVTTMVQLFESLFANRTSRCRKLHNIANSVIVLDEAQTLPASLLRPVVDVLKELVRRYGATVVLCTATQPALDGDTPHLEGFEHVEDIVAEDVASRHFASLRRVEYEAPAEEWSWREVAEKFLEAAPEKRAMAVMNTRKDALALLAELEGERALHLSTRLCGAHRRDVLDEVRRRLDAKEPCLLASTQVVEAGVDLDFPVVFRAMGPLDRIAQSAGRCNREGSLEGKGRVVVFRPADGSMPPGEYATGTDEARMMLAREGFDLHDPEIFREYFRLLYGDTPTDAKGIQNLRKDFDYPKVAKEFRFIDDPTIPVIVRYEGVDGRRGERLDEIVGRIRRFGARGADHRRLQPYVVSLFENEFERCRDRVDEIADGMFVWKGGYDDVRGIETGEGGVLDPSNLMW